MPHSLNLDKWVEVFIDLKNTGSLHHYSQVHIITYPHLCQIIQLLKRKGLINITKRGRCNIIEYTLKGEQLLKVTEKFYTEAYQYLEKK